MNTQHQGLRISKDDLKKITKNQEPSAQQKKKVEAKKVLYAIFEILLIVAYYAVAVGGRFIAGLKDTEFYQSFDVFAKPADPIHLVRLLSYGLLAWTICIVVRFLLLILSKNKTITKKTGIAILQLLSNLAKYVPIIIIICIVLSAFGVNTAGIVAGLGIVALILGLGMTSLIEDIVAGVFIIAERLFDVGDIIVLDGFRGTVVSIGIRSTKIADVGNDILTVRNSSIGSLVNLTDRMSCVAITFPIAPDEQIAHVDEVIKNAKIENIGKESPKIQGEPIYLGLYDITKKGVQLVMVIAPCKEADRYDVERILFHEIKVIFDNNNIKLGVIGTESENE